MTLRTTPPFFINPFSLGGPGYALFGGGSNPSVLNSTEKYTYGTKIYIFR